MDPEQAASRTKRTVPRWLGAVYFLGLILVLAAGIEVVARVLTSGAGNPVLKRIVSDYRQLTSEGAGWIRFVPDGELSYALRPEFTLSSPRGRGVTRHNAQGFRNDRDIVDKPAGTLRIACYGASTTYGVGVEDNGDTYPAQLEAILNQEMHPAGWERVEVWNLGVGGYTSEEILGTIRRTLPSLQPDVVLIQNAINDVIPRFYDGYRADYNHFRTAFTSLELSAIERLACRSHAWLMLAYGAGWIKPLSLQSQTQAPMPSVDRALENLRENAPTGFQQNLTEAVEAAQSAGAEVWLLTQAYLDVPEFAGPNEASRRLEGGYRQGLEEHTAIVRRLAADAGTGYIPLHEEMPRNRVYFTDPIHMSDEGNRIKAGLIAQALKGKLPVGPR